MCGEPIVYIYDDSYVCAVAKERGDGDEIAGGAADGAPSGSDSQGSAPLGASDEEFFGPGGDEVSFGVSSKETSESGDDPADVDAIDILDDPLFSDCDTDFDAPGEEMVDLAEPRPPVVDGSSTAASSSGLGEPPPLPPPLAPPPAPVAAAPESARALQFWVRGGKLSHYAEKKFMTAICDNKAHGKCVLTRTTVGRAGQPDGRPIGLMAAWLAKGLDLGTKADHWKSSEWPSFEERSAARTDFAKLTHPDAVGLQTAERPARGDEGPEPYLCAPPMRG